MTTQHDSDMDGTQHISSNLTVTRDFVTSSQQIHDGTARYNAKDQSKQKQNTYNEQTALSDSQCSKRP